jgi:hypothetical protein
LVSVDSSAGTGTAGKLTSYERGPDSPPLREVTIGADLAATTEANGSCEALVDAPSGRRWTWAAATNPNTGQPV